ncbi:hypothetical protein [Mycolicibacterium sphagni]|uniref:Autophagy-related protein 2 n=1 Tax=Mycolicibacterium sphagni TaxID=1786 RepID=A0ABX2JXP3_9MYCO|nr:hypothetical protein [Mycolicibacterium sphagni]NTY61522.1 hypothetical protein [Mycolicibacterium sphagni]
MTHPTDDKDEESVGIIGEDDPKVASSRAGKDGDDGSYVGQTGPDDAIDAGETGAEARNERGGR